MSKKNFKKIRAPEGFDAEVSSIPGVPVLRYTHGTATVESEWNFITFRKKLHLHIEKTFGDIATIFTNAKYPEYKLPKYKPEDYTIDADPLGMKKLALETEVKNIVNKREALKEKKVQVYAVIKDQLSRESLAKVSGQEGYDEADKDRDPLQLWKIILRVHLIHNDTDDIDSTKTAAQRSFNACYMTPFESLADFKERFQLRLRVYELAWSTPTQEDEVAEEFEIAGPLAATYFYERLDTARYGSIINNFKNKVYEKKNSVEEVFKFISTLRVDKPTRPQFTVTTSTKEDQGRKNTGGGRGKGLHNQGRGRGRDNRTGRNNSKGPKYGPSAERPCAICGSSDHWAKECPDKDKDTEEGKDEKSTVDIKISSHAKGKKQLMVLPRDTMCHDDLTDMVIGDISSDDELTEVPEMVDDVINASCVGDKTVPVSIVSKNVLVAAQTLVEGDIVLDTGGSEPIFCTRTEAISDLYTVEEYIRVGGAVLDGGEIVTNTKMDTTFGSVYYSKDCVADILPYSFVKDNAYECYQLKGDDVFRVRMICDSPEFIFRRKMNIYVSTKAERAKNRSQSAAMKQLVTTVNDNKKGYTKYEVERADRAREFIRRLGYPSTAKAVSMINKGGLINCDITSKDHTSRKDIRPTCSMFKRQNYKP